MLVRRNLLCLAFSQVALVATLFAQSPAGADRQKYLNDRSRLMRAERRINPSSLLRLSPSERAANEYLMRLRQDEVARTAGSFPPAKNFLLMKPSIDQSPLVEVFKRMPKGGALHAHPGAIGDFRWLVAYATYLPDCYIYTGPDSDSAVNGTFRFFRSPPGGYWRAVKDLREAAPDRAQFDEQLYQSITLGPEDLSLPDIWLEFEKCFTRVGGLQAYLPVYLEYSRRELEAIAAENVQVLELRAFLGGPMDLDGKSSGAESALSLYRQFLSETREKYPDFQLKIIYTWARAASPDSVSKKLQTALELRRKYPDFVVGFDIVNEEDRSHPLIDFLNSFLETMRAERASRVKLPYFLHAGESNRTENENLFDALLLNSKRIGHGLALIKHPLLLNLVRQRRIPIEVCPISNQVLGYIADLRNHPAVNWLRSGIPVTINPDDPGMMGYTFSYDFYEAFMAWDLDLADLKQLAMNSLRYSSLDSTEKALAMRSWKVKWYTFVTWLNSRSR